MEEIEREYHYKEFKALARATTGFEPYQLFDGNWSVCHVLVTALHDFPSLIRSRFRNDYTVVNWQSDKTVNQTFVFRVRRSSLACPLFFVFFGKAFDLLASRIVQGRGFRELEKEGRDTNIR